MRAHLLHHGFAGWLGRLGCAWLLAIGVGAALAHGAPEHAGHAAAAKGSTPAPGPQPACEGPQLACATAVTPHVDLNGRLWLAWQAAGQVVVGQLDEPQAEPRTLAVLDQPGRQLDAGADARPQIVVDARDRVVVAWSVFKDRRWNAEVRLSRSIDGGRTFSPPVLLSDDPHSQRFPLLMRDGQRGVLAAWLDKRPADVGASREPGDVGKPTGAAPGARVAFAHSADGGQSWSVVGFGPGRSCECCRLAGAVGDDGEAALLHRAIFPGSERDHALLRLPPDTPVPVLQRVAQDRWALEGCPHHGPALARDAQGRTWAAWFTQGQVRQGLFLAQSVRPGAPFSEPVAIGDAARQPGRPQLLADAGSLWLAWKTFDGQAVEVRWRRTDDGGRTWSADQVAARTDGPSDHPQLLRWRGATWLAWMTRDRGWRLLRLSGAPQPQAPAASSPAEALPPASGAPGVTGGAR